jgi:hypothetical protein
MFMQVDVPDAYRIDAKPYIERPFYVDTVEFTDTSARYSLLTPKVKFLPGDVARSNASLLNMFKMAAYGRPDLVLNISMAGTITHAGCILVGILPPLPAYPAATDCSNLINTIMSGPHAFLNANEATSVSLEVPWFCNTDLATTDMEINSESTYDITETNGNYATLVYLVLNPLKPSAGSSKILSIVVEACFKHFDLLVPTPRFLTWNSQAFGKKKQKVLSMKNPVYDMEALENCAARVHELTEVIEHIESQPKKHNDIAKYITVAAAAVGALATILRLFIGVNDVPAFEAQSYKRQSFVSGLFDMAAGGLKKVTGDFIDSGRSLLRDWTGLHNPNDPTIAHRIITTDTNFANNIDMKQHFEKLDPSVDFNRIAKAPVFGTDVDEMAIQHIAMKEQFLGTFKVNVIDPVGSLKWVRPISPFQGGKSETTNSIVCVNNLEMLYFMHRAWRGGMKLKIQSVMNNKQQVKLKVLKYYNPSSRALTGYPSYASMANAPSHLLEFTEGGQNLEVDLPYLCRNDLTPCAADYEMNAMFHGLYYIYVAQPLVVSDGSPTEIEFNVYLSGDRNLQFYGYANSNVFHDQFNLYAKSKPILEDQPIIIETPVKNSNPIETTKEPPTDIVYFTTAAKQTRHTAKTQMDRLAAAGLENHAVKGFGIDPQWFNGEERFIFKGDKIVGVHTGKVGFRAQSLKVMNEPQNQKPIMDADNKEDHITHSERLLPNVDVRPLIRRMYKSQVNQYTLSPEATLVIPTTLASYLGEDPGNWNYTPIETISRMYYGKNVGFKMRMQITLFKIDGGVPVELSDLTFRIYYLPQNITGLNTTKTLYKAPAGVGAYTNPVFPSSLGTIPFTFQAVPKHAEKSMAILEFAIPDTSFYKFMGAPQKFLNFDGNLSANAKLSTADFGTILLQVSSLVFNAEVNFAVETYVGLSDETRLGFHCIAPPIMVDKATPFYLGNNTDINGTPPVSKNSFLYRGGFL